MCIRDRSRTSSRSVCSSASLARSSSAERYRPGSSGETSRKFATPSSGGDSASARATSASARTRMLREFDEGHKICVSLRRSPPRRARAPRPRGPRRRRLKNTFFVLVGASLPRLPSYFAHQASVPRQVPPYSPYQLQSLLV